MYVQSCSIIASVILKEIGDDSQFESPMCNLRDLRFEPPMCNLRDLRFESPMCNLLAQLKMYSVQSRVTFWPPNYNC